MNYEESLLEAVTKASRRVNSIQSNVLMVGNYYTYFARIKENKRETPSTFRVVEEHEQFTSTAVPLTELINGYYPQIKSLMLIPEGNLRREQARSLGVVTDQQEHPFGIKYETNHGRLFLTVYEMKDTE